jgi:recombination DNA repair RAD52 pathway protein
MQGGDTFGFDGWTWQVLEVAAKQFDTPDEPPETLRCVPV